MASFEHLRETLTNEIERLRSFHIETGKTNLAFGDGTPLSRKQIGKGPQRRSLACTIGAEERENFSLTERQADVMQRDDGVIVYGFYGCDLEK